MTIEEAGPDPVRLAAAVHEQLGPVSGAVPVEAIARALDIVEIRTESLNSFEAALVMPDDRHSGAVWDCQDFRVRAAIMDPMEVLDGPTQSSPHS